VPSSFTSRKFFTRAWSLQTTIDRYINARIK
jgi:hypothetical protein